jgi:hypothetical protein
MKKIPKISFPDPTTVPPIGITPPADLTSMHYWWPRLRRTGVPVPQTFAHYVDDTEEFVGVIDGKPPSPSLLRLASWIREVAHDTGWPLFLRTGQTSAKHYWRDTCFVTRDSNLVQHIHDILEFSLIADPRGLPFDYWYVREFLDLEAHFTAFADMPVAKEFRAFIDAGEIVCLHPYWPEEAFEHRPETERAAFLGNRERLESLSASQESDLRETIGKITEMFRRDGPWSVDCCLNAQDGLWYVTDMAQAASSYHWPQCGIDWRTR